jgi:hypothetical protein
MSPADDATDVAISTGLSWSVSARAAEYKIYFGTSSSPSLFATTPNLSYAPSMTYSTEYFWKVCASNYVGDTCSSEYSFTTVAQPEDALSALAAGEWYEIPNSSLAAADVYPGLDEGDYGYVSGVMGAYSGAVFDTSRNKLLVWGGGHADYGGNEIYAFDLTTLTWSRLWGPSSTDDMYTSGTYNSYPAGDTNGDPSARHTRDTLVYLPVQDAIYACGGSNWRQSYNLTPWYTWHFDLSTFLWYHRADLTLSGNQLYMSAYDPTTAYVFARSTAGIYKYNPATYEWSANLRSSGYSIDQSAAIDHVSRKMGFLGNRLFSTFNVDTAAYAGYNRTTLAGQAIEILDAMSPGIEYHAGEGKFVAWTGENQIKGLDPQMVYVIDATGATPTIEKRYPTNAVTPGPSNGQGTYGRWAYVPSRDIFLVVNSTSTSVYAYKLSTTTSAPVGYGATTAAATPVVTANMESVGIKWEITGDVNHNAACAVQYRVNGTETWGDSFPLHRTDYIKASNSINQNGFYGVVLNLTDGTAYDFKLDITDADGGTFSETIVATTRAWPSLPVGGNTYYVEPGAGGGTGTAEDPFLGIAAAQTGAVAGDIFLLGAGDYGATRITFNVAGSAGNYVVWKAAEAGAILHGVYINANYVWVEGFDVYPPTGTNATFMPYPSSSASYAYVKGNNIYGDPLSTTRALMYMQTSSDNWIIADNVFTGYKNPTGGSYAGEAIELAGSDGHTVAYNEIVHVADGISSPGFNIAIFNNDIHEVSDDCIELDKGSPNTLAYRNRLTNCYHNAFSIQPVEATDYNGVPFFVIRNLIVNYGEGAMKIRGNHPFVFLQNTVVTEDKITLYNPEYMINGYAQNNIFIGVNGGESMNFSGTTYPYKRWYGGYDYNGYYYGAEATPFRFYGTNYATLALYATASGMDTNSILVDTTIFSALTFAALADMTTPRQHLTLVAEGAAIDAGVVIEGVTDGYAGAAPDLGAYEYGATNPVYGRRP